MIGCNYSSNANNSWKWLKGSLRMFVYVSVMCVDCGFYDNVCQKYDYHVCEPCIHVFGWGRRICGYIGRTKRNVNRVPVKFSNIKNPRLHTHTHPHTCTHIWHQCHTNCMLWVLLYFGYMPIRDDICLFLVCRRSFCSNIGFRLIRCLIRHANIKAFRIYGQIR